MDTVFEDKTPLWKIISVSVIGAIGVFYPFLKKGKSFEFNDILKHQKIELELNQKLSQDVFEKLKEELNLNNYVLGEESFSPFTLNFKSRMSLKSFGEKYSISIQESKLTIQSKPKFIIDFLDYGISKQNVAEIALLVNQCLK